MRNDGGSQAQPTKQSYGNSPRNGSTRNGSARTASSVQYQEPVEADAVGSGVKRKINSVQQQSYTQPTQATNKRQAATKQNYVRPSINPIDDPFGDHAPARLSPPRLSSQQNNTPRSAKRSNRSPSSRSNYSSPRAQFAAANPPSQESVLRQTSKTNYRPSGFRPPSNSRVIKQEAPSPANGGGFDANPLGNPRVEEPNPLRQPMQEEPMQAGVPMQEPPMQEPPMQDEPMRYSPMDQQVFDLDCEEINGVMLQRSIRDISLKLRPDVEEGKSIPEFCTFEGVPSAPRCWCPQTFVWTASALCSKPLYYQDIQLERYGHTRGPIIQPILSVAHFFGNVAINPYKAGIHPPNECMYALGYYRPGDCAPWLIEPFPFSARGAAGQAASAVGYSGIFR